MLVGRFFKKLTLKDHKNYNFVVENDFKNREETITNSNEIFLKYNLALTKQFLGETGK